MHYAKIEQCDIANGSGLRTSFFVSGCRNQCKGCFNKIAWDFNYGNEYTQNTENDLIKSLYPEYIAGITLLGGEPFEPENLPDLIKLVCRIRSELPQKSVWAFTGYIYEKDIKSGRLGDNAKKLFRFLDVLVDGPFIEEKKNRSLHFRGSENQRLIDVPATLKNGKVILCDNI